MTLQEILDVASNMALAGLPPGGQIDLDDTDIAETLLPSVFQAVSTQAASDENTRSLLRRSKTITFTDGVGTLDDDVLTAYKSASVLYNADDIGLKYSLVLEWIDFVSQAADRDGKFHIDGVAIRVVEPEEVYTPDEGISEDRIYVSPCGIEVPASAGDVVVAPDELINEILDKLAFALRGKVQE